MIDLAASSDLFQRTTLVVQSECSRRKRENANRGTDHGYAADTLVAGGSVNGGAFYGAWPGLRNDQLFEGQNIQVTTGFCQVLSEVLTRRLENPDLGTTFPGYTDYTPLGIVQGTDITPTYDPGGDTEFEYAPSWVSGRRGALPKSILTDP